ncbi:MAG: GNAT family N-acetyltransferase [Dysgonamonadaceae bacterium]|jgi:diamine N-acetyltransferase|nr:GNAT family N-acetyltransferase [Dysgonamonadaceae bacterium]
MATGYQIDGQDKLRLALLKDETILLRALEPEDLDWLYRWENDPELWQYGSTLAPYSRFALRDYLSNVLSQDVFQSRQLRLMIVENHSQRPVGTVDLYDLDPIHSRAGIGILLDAAYRGKGLSRQALRLMHTYASRVLLLHQLYAYVPDNNFSSYNALRKSGYEEAGLLKSWLKTADGYQDVHFMQRFLDCPS